jgi:hypothetical protein
MPPFTPPAARMTRDEYMRRWERQYAEWEAIADELVTARSGEIVTAYDVSLEQQKRALARGEVLLTAADLEAVQ